MKSRATPDFWKRFARLPNDVRKRAKDTFTLFEQDISHPSLEFKKLSHRRNYYSARISDDYRVVGLQDESGMLWFWIGSHSEYDHLLKRL